MDRRAFLRAAGKRLLAYGLPLLGGGTYGLYLEPRWLRLQRLDIALAHLPPALHGFKIAHLSDFHLLPFVPPAHVRRAVHLANGENPDVIVLTGDYVDELAGLALLPALLRELRAPLGVYGVFGNHDMWLGLDRVWDAVEAGAVTILDNRGVILPAAAPLYLAGLADAFSGMPDLDAALRDLPPDTPCVLLAHEPDSADAIARDGRTHLQLSGHSHGGQVRLPFIGAPIVPPLAHNYPDGLAWSGRHWVYTTRGIGVIGPPFGPPVRFNCRPEVALLRLHRIES